MNTLSGELRKIREEFLSQYANCEPIIKAFFEDMKKKESLKMLNTFVFCKGLIKSGEYLALDFGGSNIRISLYKVDNENIELKDARSFSLRGEDFDYTTDDYSLEDIFEMIVDEMEKIIVPDKRYLLGHTFSFAMNSKAKNTATVLELSKGFKLRDAIEQDINECLRRVILRRGLNVVPFVVLNDTTATLLSGFMMNRNTNMACIIGTGHNMCFVNSIGEIINIESGRFNNEVISLTKYDLEFLNKIPDERKFLIEALIGGKNSARLVSEVLDDLVAQNLISSIPDISPKMMSESLERNIDGLDEKQNCALREVSDIIYKRAAYLVACEILGVLRYLKVSEGIYNVVFDGTVYEKTPYFSECLTKILADLLPKKMRVTHVLAKDGSSRGAVIACAMRENKD